jgi:general stress protein YciG
MAGTKEGGRKAAMRNLAKDPNFYAKIGAKGGRNGRTGGFAANPELARVAGAKGGRISRRKKAAPAAQDVTATVAAAPIHIPVVSSEE